MRNLYYIRHGESQANVDNVWSGHFDAPLTENGWNQAKQAAQKAKDEGLKFDLILSSPLQRAYNTAKEIAQATGYPVEKIILDDDLRERFYGDMEGSPHLEPLIGNYWHDETTIDALPGVESLAAMNARAKKLLNDLKNRPEATILIVSHGAFGRMLRREIEGLPMKTAIDPYPNAQTVKLL